MSNLAPREMITVPTTVINLLKSGYRIRLIDGEDNKNPAMPDFCFATRL